MDEVYDTLARRATQLLGSSSEKRIIVAIVGVPGSGKSTLAGEVTERVNKLYGDQVAVAVPMDGFHYYRHELDAMADPAEAHRRRGAPFTFNGRGVVSMVRRLKNTLDEPVYAPTFDHKTKDPVENALEVGPQFKIVFVEGLYLLLRDKPWCEISQLVDDKWMITVDRDIAARRVARRHVAAGIVTTMEQGLQRAEFNDAVNGQLVTSESLEPDLVIESVEHTIYYTDCHSSS